MDERTQKEKLLTSVRHALLSKPEIPFPKHDWNKEVFKRLSDEKLDVNFVKKFIDNGGQFVFCDNKTELQSNIEILCNQKSWTRIICKDEKFIPILQEVKIRPERENNEIVAITSCEYLVADHGSVIFSSRLPLESKLLFSSNSVIIIATSDQITTDFSNALSRLKLKYERMPSDILILSNEKKSKDGNIIRLNPDPLKFFLFLVEEEI